MKIAILSVLITLAVFCAWEVHELAQKLAETIINSGVNEFGSIFYFIQTSAQLTKEEAANIFGHAGLDPEKIKQQVGAAHPRTAMDLIAILQKNGLNNDKIKLMELEAQEKMKAAGR